jgi:pseudoazurin
MHIILKIFSVIFLLIISNSVRSKTIQIDFTPYETYSIEVAHIDVGDTIEWLPNADHNVEFLGGPDMNSLPEKSKFNVFYSVNFNTPGVYLYHCTPHGNMGMLGLVVVGDNFNNLKDIEKIQLSPVAKSVLQKLIKISKSNS